MEKEQILKILKDLIISLKKDDKKIKEDELYRKEWQRRQQEVGIAIKKLNPADKQWLDIEYSKWFNTDIKPLINNVNPLIKDKLL